MNNKLKVGILLIIAIAGAWLVLRFVIGGDEDSWICENGQWEKHGNPSSEKPTEECSNNVENSYSQTVQLEVMAPFSRALITINSDGKIDYEGIRDNSQDLDVNTTNISEKQFSELIDLINSSGFYEMEGEYNDDTILDGTTYTITVIMEDEIEIVRCYGSCPEGFTEIRKKIEELYGGDIINIGV